VVLVGIPGIARGVDWTAIFAQELTVLSARQFHDSEEYQGKSWRAFDLALDLMKKGKLDLGWMISRKYPLSEYKRALSDLAQKGSRGIIKVAFEFTS
jgi:threonine dehydrogenase-like Zn-dependent dehydrogenase